MAKAYNMTVEDLKSRIPEDKDNFVTETVIHRKAVEKLVASALPVAPPPEPEPAEEAAAAMETADLDTDTETAVPDNPDEEADQNA